MCKYAENTVKLLKFAKYLFNLKHATYIFKISSLCFTRNILHGILHGQY